jgi:hypothetical protein
MRPERIEFKNGIPVNIFVRSGNKYPFHWHDALEIIQVLSGSVKIGMGNDNQVLKKGDIAITNMGEIHHMTGDGEDEILFIHIDGDFCCNVLPDCYMFIYCCSAYHEAKVPEKYGIVNHTPPTLRLEVGASCSIRPPPKVSTGYPRSSYGSFIIMLSLAISSLRFEYSSLHCNPCQSTYRKHHKSILCRITSIHH